MVTPGNLEQAVALLYQFKSYLFSVKPDTPKQDAAKPDVFKQDEPKPDLPKPQDELKQAAEQQNPPEQDPPFVPKNLAHLPQLLLDQVEKAYGLFGKSHSPLKIPTTIHYQGMTTIPHVYECEMQEIEDKRDSEYDIIDEETFECDYERVEPYKKKTRSVTVNLKSYHYYCQNERNTTVLFEPIAVRRDNQARLETILKYIEISLLGRGEGEQEYLAIIPVGEWAAGDLKKFSFSIAHFTVVALSKKKGKLAACIFDSRGDPGSFVLGLRHVPFFYRVPYHLVPTLDTEINACFRAVFKETVLSVPRIYLGAQSLWDWNSCGYHQLKVIYHLFKGTLCVGEMSDSEIAQKIIPTKEECTAILREISPKLQSSQTPPVSPSSSVLAIDACDTKSNPSSSFLKPS